MNFPYVVCDLTNEEAQVFKKYFEDNGTFNFEGVWFRSQKKINKASSGWKNESDKRKKVIHFYDTYKVVENKLVILESYLYVSKTLPKKELDSYIKNIIKTLNLEADKKEEVYFLGDLEIIINRYDKNPKEEYIEDYETVDIVIKTKGKETKELYEKLWALSKKGIREKDIRENPKYINDLSEFKEFLPAQIELGCGPSIEAGIPPLYYLHEIYKVQRHTNGKFYFGAEDDLVCQVIKDPLSKYKEFSHMIKRCIKAKPTNFQNTLKKFYDKGIFVGNLINNNFDRLAARVGIEEEIIRVYDINDYFPKIDFDPRAKSLLCIGTHADRRKIQKRAREKGLKIIYVDCEGFYKNEKFSEYLIEGPKDQDLILKITANEFANLLEKEFKSL